MTQELDVFKQEIGKLAHDIKSENELAIKAALAGEHGRSAELKSQIDARIDGIVENQNKIEALLTKQARSTAQAAPENSALALKGFKVAVKSFGGGQAEVNADTYAEYKKHFGEILRKDRGLLGAAEQKALQVGVLTDGGYTVPQELDSEIIRLNREYSMFRGMATNRTISTDKYEKVVQVGGAAAGWVAETAARPATSTPTFQKISIDLFELYANPQVTQWMLDDPMLDMESFLANEVGSIFAKTEQAAFITGSGAGEPKGILSYADGTAYNQVKQILAGAATFTSGAAQADALLEMIYGASGLNADYLAKAQFVMNKATLLQILKLKSTAGEYIWDIDKTNGFQIVIHGKPININPDMPIAAANALAVVFADFKEAYTIVDKMGTRILRDPYSNKPYIGYYTTKRVGGGVTNSQAVRILKMA